MAQQLHPPSNCSCFLKRKGNVNIPAVPHIATLICWSTPRQLPQSPTLTDGAGQPVVVREVESRQVERVAVADARRQVLRDLDQHALAVRLRLDLVCLGPVCVCVKRSYNSCMLAKRI